MTIINDDVEEDLETKRDLTTSNQQFSDPINFEVGPKPKKKKKKKKKMKKAQTYIVKNTEDPESTEPGTPSPFDAKIIQIIE